MENLKIVSSFHKASRTKSKVESRECHAFIFRVKGYADYSFDGKTVRIDEGEMIFLPKGSAYSYVTPQQPESLYTSVNFNADGIGLEIKVYSLSDFHNAKYMAESFTELWNLGDESDRYKCYALVYELAAHITRLESLGDAEKRRFSAIEPAVEYLKKHVYDAELKVNKLHKLCGMSDTYFRRLFVMRFNMTPNKYLTETRLSYAKTVIDSGDYTSISEVAYLVGFDDPLYFSKAYKKFYGYPPSFRSQ